MKLSPHAMDEVGKLGRLLTGIEAIEILITQRDEARAEVERVRAGLDEALRLFGDASQYKGDYLRKKHGDEEEIERLRKLLEPPA